MKIRKILIFLVGVAFITAGCDTEYRYVHPKYPIIKTIKRVQSANVSVDIDGRLKASSTKNMFNLVSRLRKKEAYYDRTLAKWNKRAQKNNKEAAEHNKKIKAPVGQIK